MVVGRMRSGKQTVYLGKGSLNIKTRYGIDHTSYVGRYEWYWDGKFDCRNGIITLIGGRENFKVFRSKRQLVSGFKVLTILWQREDGVYMGGVYVG